jgi:hypothetical protein
MTDPERLLDGGGSELERELLGSLASERPTPALSRRMRQALLTLGLLTSAKTGVAGVVALVGLVSVGAGTAWVVQHRYADVRQLPAVSASQAVGRAVASAARRAPPAPSAEPVSPPLSPVAPRSSGAAAAAPSATGDLREQIALLDRARAAVRAHDSKRALAELGSYKKQFPRGEFSQEVTVLKIEALAQDGQMDGARALGKRFLAAHPESPHVERIERLVGAAP